MILPMTYLESTNAVSITSGNLCLTNYLGSIDAFGGIAASAMPPISEYGQDFQAPPITGFEVTGYVLRILAAEDNTHVSYVNSSVVLNAGYDVSIQCQDLDDKVALNCSKPCLVTQVTYSREFTMGVFMMRVIPTEQFYKSAIFATMDSDETHYISIVVNGVPPNDHLYLDGESLVDLDWREDGEVSYAYMVVGRGYHRMHSVEKMFAVYIYSHTLVREGGYGYAVLPSGITIYIFLVHSFTEIKLISYRVKLN